MGRHERRASLAAFRREAAGALITHLIDVNEPLDHHPPLARAVAYWRRNIQQRKPFCISCKQTFSDGTAVGAWLFATSEAGTGAASVSAVCSSCWRTLPMAEIEDHTLRVMSKLLRGARFDSASP